MFYQPKEHQNQSRTSELFESNPLFRDIMFRYATFRCLFPHLPCSSSIPTDQKPSKVNAQSNRYKGSSHELEPQISEDLRNLRSSHKEAMRLLLKSGIDVHNRVF
ncbi:hypothetical protein J6590_101933, partial [Homalodisca vitripennis]